MTNRIRSIAARIAAWFRRTGHAGPRPADPRTEDEQWWDGHR